MAKFIVFTPSYNERSGGVVVLHKLCHILNELGHEAFLYPYAYTYEVNRFNISQNILNFIKWSVFTTLMPFKINNSFNTPLYKGKLKDIKEYVVIYPEVVFGNPLNAKNVVRWLLHQPGFHENKFYYNPNELIFKFNSAIKDFEFPGSKTSKNDLKVIHYPLDIYNKKDLPDSRSGYCYCIRKGQGKTHVRDHCDDILIDDLTHEEIAKVFKRSEYFISYDTYTAYSIFAVLCGCKSIVVGDNDTAELDWYPNEKDRYGLSYGLPYSDWADRTKDLVLDNITKEIEKVNSSVRLFVSECEEYFSLDGKG